MNATKAHAAAHPVEPATRGDASAGDPCFSSRGSSKIQGHHRERLAVVYVRQSSPQQVLAHRESAALQYALAHRAVALGWSEERVLVIDEDQGHSAVAVEDRLGFQRLLAEVGLNHVGLILGIEMSRLARSNKDWHQLLELCTLFRSLLADQDGLYDPGDYNDRLLLGLKGTISEAELHILQARMEQGRRNKAQRGELFNSVPMGYVLLPSGNAALDPDEQAQAVVHLLFDKFEELGTAMAVVRYMLRHGIRMPARSHFGSNKGQLEWRRPCQSTVLNMLNHPIYAGAYAYGRHPTDSRRKIPGRHGTGKVRAPMEQWHVLHKDRLPAYITWERYLANQRRLTQNAASFKTLGAARKGPSLLAGLAFCGYCGYRLNVAYCGRTQSARYNCQSRYREGRRGRCQSLAGDVLDALVSGQVLQALGPAALELSLQAAEDIQRERDRLHKHWQHGLERARYEAERAKRQYDAVEPENRLVARELERRWEQSLLEERQLHEEYDRYRGHHPHTLTESDRQTIASLSSEVRALWDAPSTTAADRKTIIRHLVERVVVRAQGKTEVIDVTIHWQGGFVSQHEVLRSVAKYEQLHDYESLKQRIVELRCAGRTAVQIAESLNQEGFRTPQRGKTYTGVTIGIFLSRSGLSGPHPGAKNHGDRLGPNEYWLSDMAEKLSMPLSTLNGWRCRGWIHARQVGARRWWVGWADRKELDRLRKLRASWSGLANVAYPAELTTPRPRGDTWPDSPPPRTNRPTGTRGRAVTKGAV